MATPTLLREHVSEVADDAVAAFGDLVRGVPESRIDDLLLDALPGLIFTYGEMAAVLAAEWYDEARDEAAATGTFIASAALMPDVGIEGLVGWARQTATSFPAMLKLIEGGSHKRVANGARRTIMDATRKDRAAEGWQRYARLSGGCDFCQMLAGRGFVYKSTSTATFSAHDNCKCVVVPKFGGAPLMVRPYEPTDRNITDADRARVRAWIASH